METIRIIDYEPAYQPAVNEMMELIQAEYPEAITTHHSTVIKDVYKDPDQKFWLALSSAGEVAGTAGIKLGRGYAEVKRMFVHPLYRRPQFQTAELLINAAAEQAKLLGYNKLYLGTMTQFRAAQRFYEKSGFQKIDITELPPDYKLNPMDSVFYYKEI